MAGLKLLPVLLVLHYLFLGVRGGVQRLLTFEFEAKDLSVSLPSMSPRLPRPSFPRRLVSTHLRTTYFLLGTDRLRLRLPSPSFPLGFMLR